MFIKTKYCSKKKSNVNFFLSPACIPFFFDAIFILKVALESWCLSQFLRRIRKPSYLSMDNVDKTLSRECRSGPNGRSSENINIIHELYYIALN